MKLMVRRASPALQAEKISMAQFWALHMISSIDVAPLGSVARRLGVSLPTFCAKVDELEEAGLVARQRSKTDRRVVELSLTPKGRRAEARVWTWIGEQMTAAVRELSREDVMTTIRVFETIHAKFEANVITPGGRP
jgi:DNA-binding MarR family transcriptional regulator